MHHLEIKSAFTVDDAGTITGNAWPFGSPDQAGDLITKGAFGTVTRALMLWQHKPDEVIGDWEVAEDDNGLQVKGQLLIGDVARAREAHALVKRQLVTGLSIGFHTKASKLRTDARRGRIISAVDLVEVSLVTLPSHPHARISGVKALSHAPRDPVEVAEIINRAALALRNAA